MMSETQKYLNHKFIKPDAVEFRDYQTNLAEDAKKENCLVVLPTGLGKTVYYFLHQQEFLSTNTMSFLKKIY